MFELAVLFISNDQQLAHMRARTVRCTPILPPITPHHYSPQHDSTHIYTFSFQ